jgi:hypothetical protein
MLMMKYPRLLTLVAGVLAISACSDSDNDDQSAVPPPAQAQMRITHASPDAPKVNVYVDGALALEGVDYKQSSGIITRAAGAVEIEVRGLLADGSETSVIGPAQLELAENTRTDVVAINTLAAIEPTLITDDDTAAVSGVEVRVLHAAPAVANVDIYVTGPDDDIASVTPVKAGFGDAAGPLALEPETNYRVRITPENSATVVYDSGTLSFPAGTDLLLVAVENTTGIGSNPVNLLAVGADSASEVYDASTGAQVRVVHNSADTPAVDVIVDGNTALSGLTFPNATDYEQLEAPAGTYNVVVAATTDNTIAPINVDLTLEQARSYTAIAIGALNGISDNTITAVVTEDERRNIATEARVRVVHGSYAVAAEIPVDVFLTADADISAATPAINNLTYGTATAQLPVSPGDYVITVTAAGDKSVVAFSSAAPVPLEGGVNYTIIARDPAVGEDPTPNLILPTILTD